MTRTLLAIALSTNFVPDAPAGADPFRRVSGGVYADSDDDGLYDTIETVIGTDPENNDTDFDQLPDGEEVDL